MMDANLLKVVGKTACTLAMCGELDSTWTAIYQAFSVLQFHKIEVYRTVYTASHH